MSAEPRSIIPAHERDKEVVSVEEMLDTLEAEREGELEEGDSAFLTDGNESSGAGWSITRTQVEGIFRAEDARSASASPRRRVTAADLDRIQGSVTYGNG